jgi:hypothetical protein
MCKQRYKYNYLEVVFYRSKNVQIEINLRVVNLKGISICQTW